MDEITTFHSEHNLRPMRRGEQVTTEVAKPRPRRIIGWRLVYHVILMLVPVVLMLLVLVTSDRPLDVATVCVAFALIILVVIGGFAAYLVEYYDS